MTQEKRYYKTSLYGFTGEDHAYACVLATGLHQEEDDPAFMKAYAVRLVEQNPAIREVYAVTNRPGLGRDYRESKGGMGNQIVFHEMVRWEGVRVL